MKPWLEVDRKGLAQILERRGKGFVIAEVVQNAWDEQDQGMSRVDLSLKPIPGKPQAELQVIDDSPEGFRDLRDAFTLFAPSYKKGDPRKRGRFNLGEKLLLAISVFANITSTKGTVTFGDNGRVETPSAKRPRGTCLLAHLKMTRAEVAEALILARRLIPPKGVVTTINGEEIPHRDPVGEGTESLTTEIADEEGVLRRVERKTTVQVYETLPGEPPTIYEMGIPVVEHDGRWHVDVQQKVPLDLERGNVTPAYLRKIRTLLLNEMAGKLTKDECSQPWVREAVPYAQPGAVRTALTKRFGKRALVVDPSSPEANKRALDQGRQLVSGGSMSKAEWGAARSAFEGTDTLAPAGQVIKVGVPTSPDGVPPIPRKEWTPGMLVMEVYIQRFGEHVIGRTPKVEFFNIPRFRQGCGAFGAWYGRSEVFAPTLSINIGVLGKKWVEEPDQLKVDELLIHEFSHQVVSDHLSGAFHRECCRIGAKIRSLQWDLQGEIEFHRGLG